MVTSKYTACFSIIPTPQLRGVQYFIEPLSILYDTSRICKKTGRIGESYTHVVNNF